MLHAICLLASAALGLAAVTPEVTVYTEEDPPYNFAGKDGQPAGFAVEVVREIQKRVGD
jgi:ABC-type amino acid transport substrate-binding protein